MQYTLITHKYIIYTYTSTGTTYRHTHIYIYIYKHHLGEEHIPFSFSIDSASFHEEGGLQALSISPMSGVVSPDSATTIAVSFKPLEAFRTLHE